MTSVSPNFRTINEIWKNKSVIYLFDSLLIGIFSGFIYYAYSPCYFIFNVDNMFVPLQFIIDNDS